MAYKLKAIGGITAAQAKEYDWKLPEPKTARQY
jgi:hypothetical protein